MTINKILNTKTMKPVAKIEAIEKLAKKAAKVNGTTINPTVVTYNTCDGLTELKYATPKDKVILARETMRSIDREAISAANSLKALVNNPALEEEVYHAKRLELIATNPLLQSIGTTVSEDRF